MIEPGYIRLKAQYQLRGWQGLPYALINRKDFKPIFLSAPAFRTVQFCNGRFEADSPIFIGKSREYLKALDEQGALEYLDGPGNLDPEQEYLLYDNRYLSRVHWSLTGHCNYRCRHCYMSAPHAMLPHPTTEKCLEIVDQIADCGIMRISLTGGEPLIRRDFMQIVDRILERGMRLDVIMTNGALVSEELLDALDERNCHPEFNMSFDGPGQWHDWLRGVDGAYDSVRRAFRLCHERGFVTGSEMVLHKGNLHTLRESVRELGELGVSSLKVNRLNCVGEGEALSDYAITTAEEYATYLEYIPQYFEDGMPVPILTLSGMFQAFEGRCKVGAERHPEDKDAGPAPICASARHTMYLGPDGAILPCIPMSEHEGVQGRFPNVSGMTLKEALSDSFYMEFISTNLAKYLEHNPECAACEYRNRCGGGCRGRAMLANDGSDLLAKDPDTCMLFKGGYYDRVKELIEQYAPAK
ncbi:MAG: radical SAM protein [Atopobiaceae bacterium]|nr:radical SAM protein [Atopobiaceae bacterium]